LFSPVMLGVYGVECLSQPTIHSITSFSPALPLPSVVGLQLDSATSIKYVSPISFQERGCNLLDSLSLVSSLSCSPASLYYHTPTSIVTQT
jgi:hypothetical protein